MLLNAKIVSALEKILPGKELSDYPSHHKMSALLGEKISIQVIFKNAPSDNTRTLISPRLGGELAKYATVRRVLGVPVTMPAPANICLEIFITLLYIMYNLQDIHSLNIKSTQWAPQCLRVYHWCSHQW